MKSNSSDTYLTIAAPSQGLYKEKGSKFISFAYPIQSEEEIKNILGQLKKEYYDARHHCFAFMLGTNATRYRANDDGEPNHSAGDPILGQIRSAGITNVLVVVVRYFGGIKLGVSGLIYAYRTAAADALANAEIIEKIEMDTLTVSFDYEQMNTVMSVIKDLKLEVLTQDFELNCRLVIASRKNITDQVKTKLNGVAAVTPV
ncbi:IMPACT family protein [Adhaeribacter aquaticus]|uniref:IMPACT family protein n=1 Tax=Adhaeribacter aquaticus TaxID=299567 RepID=UPI000401A302|nr:YigZ family protein [Adhaeribacter aquaticus]